MKMQKCTTIKNHKHVGEKKCFENSISYSVFALSYMPLYGVTISVLCNDVSTLIFISPQIAGRKVSVLQAECSLLHSVTDEDVSK